MRECNFEFPSIIYTLVNWCRWWNRCLFTSLKFTRIMTKHGIWYLSFLLQSLFNVKLYQMWPPARFYLDSINYFSAFTQTLILLNLLIMLRNYSIICVCFVWKHSYMEYLSSTVFSSRFLGKDTKLVRKQVFVLDEQNLFFVAVENRSFLSNCWFKIKHSYMPKYESKLESLFLNTKMHLSFWLSRYYTWIPCC